MVVPKLTMADMKMTLALGILFFKFFIISGKILRTNLILLSYYFISFTIISLSTTDVFLKYSS